MVFDLYILIFGFPILIGWLITDYLRGISADRKIMGDLDRKKQLRTDFESRCVDIKLERRLLEDLGENGGYTRFSLELDNMSEKWIRKQILLFELHQDNYYYKRMVLRVLLANRGKLFSADARLGIAVCVPKRITKYYTKEQRADDLAGYWSLVKWIDNKLKEAGIDEEILIGYGNTLYRPGNKFDGSHFSGTYYWRPNIPPHCNYKNVKDL